MRLRKRARSLQELRKGISRVLSPIRVDEPRGPRSLASQSPATGARESTQRPGCFQHGHGPPGASRLRRLASCVGDDRKVRICLPFYFPSFSFIFGTFFFFLALSEWFRGFLLGHTKKWPHFSRPAAISSKRPTCIFVFPFCRSEVLAPLSPNTTPPSNGTELPSSLSTGSPRGGHEGVDGIVGDSNLPSSNSLCLVNKCLTATYILFYLFFGSFIASHRTSVSFIYYSFIYPIL